MNNKQSNKPDYTIRTSTAYGNMCGAKSSNMAKKCRSFIDGGGGVCRYLFGICCKRKGV